MSSSAGKPAPETGDSLNSQMHLLRSRVEAELDRPAVVMVTSALPGDGKSLTAHSLAVSFGRSGRRVALAGAAAGIDQRGVTVVNLPPKEGRVAEHDGLVAFVDKLRAEYDYTIVDAGTFLRSNTAMALAPLVDGILLAVRVGRAPSDDDELLVRTIEHSRGRVLGVVATDTKAVEGFARERAGERPAAAPTQPARRVETHAAVFAGGRVLEGKA